MSRVGVNITVTSLVDVVALLLSLFSLLPAVRYFGVYAAVGILYIYLSYVTAFVAFIALDERRRAAGRRDLVSCVPIKPPLAVEYVATTRNATTMDVVDRLMQTRYAPFLLRRAVRAAVIAAFLGLTGFLLWAALTQEGYDFHTEDLLPDDSPAYEYITMCKSLFRGLEFPDNSVALYFTDIDYADAEVQTEMRALIDAANALPCMLPNSTAVDWHAAMTAFGQNAVRQGGFGLDVPPMDPTQTYFVGQGFYTVLQAFLAQPEYAFVYSPYLSLNATSGAIEMSAIGMTLDFLSSAAAQVSALDSWRALTAASPFGPQGQAFMSNDNEAFWEQLGFMKDEATRLFALTIAAAAVVSAFFLVHPVAVLIQVVALAIVFIDLLGALALSGVQINSISVVNLVMAVGLCIDGTLHVIRIFSVQDPALSREARVTRSLGELGTPILLGAVSLVLGVVSLSTASSAVFHTFFVCFGFIVLFAFGAGLTFVPVVLSLIGPVTFVDVEDPDFLRSPGAQYDGSESASPAVGSSSSPPAAGAGDAEEAAKA